MKNLSLNRVVAVELMSLNPNEQSGSCQCGSIRYAVPKRPLVIYACHCTECRKQSSSAFGLSFTVPRSSLRVLTGSPQYWSRKTASGYLLECAFCSGCGSRLWHRSSGHPGTLNIKGGSLDEPLDITDAVHIWVSSKLPGVVIPAAALSFPREPDGEP
jgi:hypothetical protein